jgi:hypothetical protein
VFVKRVYEVVEMTPDLKGRGLRLMDALRRVFPEAIGELTEERRVWGRKEAGRGCRGHTATTTTTTTTTFNTAANGALVPSQPQHLPPAKIMRRAFAPSKSLPLLDLRKLQEERELVSGKSSARPSGGAQVPVSVMDVAWPSTRARSRPTTRRPRRRSLQRSWPRGRPRATPCPWRPRRRCTTTRPSWPPPAARRRCPSG